MKDFYNENYRALMKETKEATKLWRDITCSWSRRINIIKMSTLLKAIDKFKIITLKISIKFFTELKKNE
jgi:hypothetical protein